MAEIKSTAYFETAAEAYAAKAEFLANYSGAWNPYEGRATVSPPNDDRPTWAVYFTRNSSAD